MDFFTKSVMVAMLVAGLVIGGLVGANMFKADPVVVTKDRVITKTEIVRPDGTVETVVVDKESTPAQPSAKPDYSVAVEHPVDKPDVNKVSVEVGRRIVGNVWGTVNYQPADNRVGVGVRVEF